MALLRCPRCYRHIGGTAQQGIDEVAQTQQIIERADEFRSLRRAGGSVEVGPIGGDQRLTAVRQNEHELQAARHVGLPKDLKRLSLEWMMRTRDGYAFGEVLMVGSVWWFPSTTSVTSGC
jgi:hypothetical protein